MKQKTHSGAKKRFKVTRNGKVRGKNRNRAHLLEKKSSSRKRRLKGLDTLDKTAAKSVKKLLNK